MNLINRKKLLLPMDWQISASLKGREIPLLRAITTGSLTLDNSSRLKTTDVNRRPFYKILFK